MDPDVNTAEQRELLTKAAVMGHLSPADRARLRELRRALIEWRSMGGFAPREAPPTPEQWREAGLQGAIA